MKIIKSKTKTSKGASNVKKKIQDIIIIKEEKIL